MNRRLYSFINIAGLAIGLAACLLIGLFVRHEFSYDGYHPDAERIYRVTRDYYARGGTPELRLATNAPPAAPALQADFPQVEAATRISNNFNLLVTHGETSLNESQIRFADANVFEFFQFDWLYGDPSEALAPPGKVVLTESMARRYFGAANPVGEVLEAQYGITLEVAGVIRDLPDNTHLRLDALASLTTLSSRPGANFAGNWGDNGFYTYVKLREGANPDDLAGALPAFLNRHHQADASSFTGMSVQRLTDIHLRSSTLQAPMKAPGSLETVLACIAIALCILLIALVNFTNLAVARSLQRAREVGMRKAVGASRLQIAARFVGESMLSVFAALLIGVVFVELTRPVFENLLDMRLSFDLAADPGFGAGILGGALLAGILAGAYPAFYLSAFEAARVLRGEMDRGREGQWFRNALVVAQFAAAIVLIVATAVIYRQLEFARTLDMGFRKDDVVILDNLDSRWETLRPELLNLPGVLGVTASNMAPGEDNANSFVVRYEGGGERGFGMQFLAVDYGFFRTYDIDLLAGREFSAEFGVDRIDYPSANSPHPTGGVILSAMAVRRFGWSPESALGKGFELSLRNDFAQSIRGTVVGVVDDIHFESAATAIEPVAYVLPPADVADLPGLSTASIRVDGNAFDTTLERIAAAWARVYPERPLALSFLDANLAALYSRDEKLGRLCAAFASLAVLVACLGLFGLASFNTQRRTREIGVRKVMGGTVWSIVWLLTYDFSRLVLLANLIAWPVAYVAMERWLENFAYRIDLTPLVFAGSGAIALCIAWVTVGGTAAKAASAKPVLALRYE